MRNFIQDLRYAVRVMAKRPGFTIVAALTLALGIGANTAILSAVNAVLLKPLPFPESEQLLDLSETFKPNGFGSVSVPNFEDWRSQNTVFAGISAYQFTSFNLEGSDTPQRVPGMQVSSNYFDVLGVKPARGRAFLPGEDVAGSERVVVIGEELWRSNFAANPDIVNQTVPLNGQKYTVVGVMPRDLSSLYGLLQTSVPEMYAPYTLKDFWPDMRWNMRLLVRSTLDSNSIAAAVRREVQAVDHAQPIYAVQTMNIVIDNTVKDKSLNTTLMTIFAGVSLLLAVIGVYGVMSYTVAQHTREIGIRMALGAQPRTILKLVVSRGLVLVAVGALIGVLASFGLTRFIEGMLFGVTPTDPFYVCRDRDLAGIRSAACLFDPGATCDASRSDSRLATSVKNPVKLSFASNVGVPLVTGQYRPR